MIPISEADRPDSPQETANESGIEIAPEMVRAGAAVLRQFVHEPMTADFEELAGLVFRTMESVRTVDR